MLNHSPKSKWPQLSFLTDFIRLTFNPCLSAWPKRCHKFPNFLSAFLISPKHYTVVILSAFISLYLYPKHTNVYKTVTWISSKSKWFVRPPEISPFRLRRSWLSTQGTAQKIRRNSPNFQSILCSEVLYQQFFGLIPPNVGYSIYFLSIEWFVRSPEIIEFGDNSLYYSRRIYIANFAI